MFYDMRLNLHVVFFCSSFVLFKNQINFFVMKVRIKKLEELKDALHPNNIEVGYERVIDVHPDYFEQPKLDKRFNVGSFSTSGVQEILDEKTFRTYSSIYEWEVLEPNQK